LPFPSRYENKEIRVFFDIGAYIFSTEQSIV
jgi:hypothetical protein